MFAKTEVNLRDMAQQGSTTPDNALQCNARSRRYMSYVGRHNRNDWRAPSNVAAVITAVAALVTACMPLLVKLF
jgi:hypothetical protein